MGYVIFLAATLALFIGFLALTYYETRRGERLFPKQRAVLDAQAGRIVFITEHVDLQAFMRETVRLVIARVAHDLAHTALVITRFVERILTQIVRTLRTHHLVVRDPAAPPRSEFVAAMKDFKQELRDSRKLPVDENLS